ncbi:Sodium channel protein Nach [Habropoda laboriosa]|uniref:Sodium channel protein Nach n=1 Tax=Habropoda laboriosa TaxID=597456 RepID=A0A0L7R119_9HYME|nr:PREDICTED: sodium channel protein Nach-like [Habropoda laboriosa]KOC64550.1 Sodium channel protein Nach [Habropoda laboriosa]
MKYKYKPLWRDLRSSLKSRSREYFLENSLHGVPYFVDSTRPKWERITWFLLTVLSIVAIIAIIETFLNKFQTEPTITGLDVTTEHIDIEFPQTFICFDWFHLNHSYIREDEIHMYEQLYNWTLGKNINLTWSNMIYASKNDFRRILPMMAPDCDYFIKDCMYRGINISCGQIFTKRLTPVGACCRSKSLEPLQIMDASWNLEFKIANSNFPLRLYITQYSYSGPTPGERPAIKTYFPVDIEFSAEITYATSDIRYLLLGQRKCYYKQEGVSLNDCEINCFRDKLLAQCECLPWYLSFVDKTECTLSKYACLNNVIIDVTQCNCYLSCDHTSYRIKGIKKSSKNVSRIMLRNWPTALYKREMRFGYLDLLVSFGGIASLFLGYSLLSSVEFGYYFSLRAYCGAVVQSSRKQYNIVTVHVVEKLPSTVDSNLKYYQYID